MHGTPVSIEKNGIGKALQRPLAMSNGQRGKAILHACSVVYQPLLSVLSPCPYRTYTPVLIYHIIKHWHEPPRPVIKQIIYTSFEHNYLERSSGRDRGLCEPETRLKESILLQLPILLFLRGREDIGEVKPRSRSLFVAREPIGRAAVACSLTVSLA